MTAQHYKISKTLILFQVVRYTNKNFNNPLKIPKNIGVKLLRTSSGLKNGRKSWTIRPRHLPNGSLEDVSVSVTMLWVRKF